MREKIFLKHIRWWILIFIICISLSGITAFPLEAELCFLDKHADYFFPAISEWIHRVYTGIKNTNDSYPFIAYGTDWLAFAHLIIALLFIGPLMNPIRNKWIIDWGILCCILVFPLALIAGPNRGIPFFHRLIDCSFGFIGIIPLIFVRNKIILLEKKFQAPV
jgi:hypothetical protein